MVALDDNLLGSFLKDRRARLDPAAFGFSATRRRTPGLRREEVALRANVSATWYTWLEQGRHGAPSADVLDRLVKALQLTPAEREHLFSIAHRRPLSAPVESHAEVTSRLQRLLDSLENSPAFAKTPTWDIVAWNRAASLVLTDYSKLMPEERNVLRLLFCNPARHRDNPHWESQARLVVATFRLDTARVGFSERARELVSELSARSPQFAALWNENDVNSYGEGTKHINHPIAGPLGLDYATLAVDGRADLSIVIYTPASAADRENVQALLDAGTPRDRVQRRAA